MFDHSTSYDPSADCASIERYRETFQETEEKLDSPVDQLIGEMFDRARNYGGGIPITGGGLSKIVATIARAVLTVEAISGLVSKLVNEQLQTLRIEIVGAILSLVKDAKPHLTIDVIEHVFHLAHLKESDIARKHGESRQVVNKRVKAMQRHFGVETDAQEEVALVYSHSRVEQYKAARQRIIDIRNRP